MKEPDGEQLPESLAPIGGDGNGGVGGPGIGIDGPPPPPPVITRITPAAALPGARVTISGSGFGLVRGSVVFEAAGVGSAAASIVSWQATSIVVTVPALTAFGSGGPLDVVVQVGDNESGPAAFLLLEPTPPAIASIVPPRGLEHVEVVVSGTHFGRRSTGSAVFFASPGTGPKVAAEIVSWQPDTVHARVPALTDLGSAGTKNVTVGTPWGESQPVSFLVGELPSISSVNPPSASPQVVIALSGRAFGARDQSSKVELLSTYRSEDAPPVTTRVAMPIESWTETHIEVRVPSFGQVQTSGRKGIVVTTSWGESAPAVFSVIDRASVTAWTRLEPHARVDDLEVGLRTGLQACVDDALWLLGRQWQIGELRGEDAGSPVAARIVAEAARVSRWRPGDAGPLAVPPNVPLEALAERETILRPLGVAGALGDSRLAVEAGLQFIRFVGRRLADPIRTDDYRKRYLDVYALPPPTSDERLTLPAETIRFLDLAAGRVPDGSRLYADLWVALPSSRGGQGRLPDRPPVAGSEQAAILAAVGDWFDWLDAMFSDARGGASAWDSPRLEYSFAVAAATSAGEVVLEAREYDGNRLDWYSFARATGESLGAAEPATPVTRSVLPSPASYVGMPAPRWWELESSRVDFGGVEAGPSDLLRLLFVEFALVYGNDWFVAPVERLPVGSVCRLRSLVVTDTFDVETEVAPFTGDVGAGEAWRMFRLTGGSGDLLFNPGALPSSLVSPPLEEVLFTRDELANLAWGIERVVEGPSGRPVDRLEAYQAQRGREDAAAPPPEPSAPGTPALAYRIATTVPPYWIPFVPSLERHNGQVSARKLVRAALRDAAGAPIAPQGELLGAAEASFVYDEEVPRAGVRVTRTWEYARGADGSTHLWRGRRAGIGRGESSSGLRFDVLERRD